MPLPTHSRYDYSPILHRPPWRWPNDTGLAVYIAINLEHFSFGGGLGAQLALPPPTQPDVLNFSWRDYGNRVGAWRLLDLLKEYEFPCSCLVNSEIYSYCPELLKTFQGEGHEIVAHGRGNHERQGGLAEDEERRLIAEATEVLETKGGVRPKGWLSPWISESNVTPDLLQEAGYKYTLNWASDDQPFWMRTRSGSHIVSVPYPQELNDIPTIVPNRRSHVEFVDMIICNLREMERQVERTGQALVMGIALHPYIMGQPFRLHELRRALDVLKMRQSAEKIWLTRAGDVAEYFAGLDLKASEVTEGGQ